MDFPTKQISSLYIDGSGDCRLKLNPLGRATSDNYYSSSYSEQVTIWNRRLDYTRFNTSGVHASDLKAVHFESLYYVQSFFGLHLDNTRWVNTYESSITGSIKSYQLQIANKVGLKIPDTLMSNIKTDITKFIKKHNEKTICKPFLQKGWNQEIRRFVQIASEIRLSDIDNEQEVRFCPQIYQEYIQKAYELRVVVLGDRCMTLKIDSQKNLESQVDWRGDYLGNTEYSVYTLPDSIWQKIRKFMREMNLEFGCIDLICTPNGEYYFLEINQQGQFLWMEEICEEFNLLEEFCCFLTETDKSTINFPSLKDYYASPDHEKLSSLLREDTYSDLSLLHGESE